MTDESVPAAGLPDKTRSKWTRWLWGPVLDNGVVHLWAAVGLLVVSAVVFFTPVPYGLFEAYYKVMAVALLVEFVHLIIMMIRSLVSKRFRNALYALLAVVVLALIPVAFFIVAYVGLAA